MDDKKIRIMNLNGELSGLEAEEAVLEAEFNQLATEQQKDRNNENMYR